MTLLMKQIKIYVACYRYGYPLPLLAIETARYSVNKLFSNILDAYVEHKGLYQNLIIESFHCLEKSIDAFG